MNVLRKSKRRVLAFIAFLLVAFLLLAQVPVAHGASHECTGEHCPVCAFVHGVERTLRLLGAGMIFAACLPAMMQSVWQTGHHRLPTFFRITPVTMKTRMNN